MKSGVLTQGCLRGVSAALLATSLLAASGCVLSGGPDMRVVSGSLENTADFASVPTVVPLRDVVCFDGTLVGLGGRELVSLRAVQAGRAADYRVWLLPEDIRPRPVIAAGDSVVWLIDSQRLRLYRVRLGEQLRVDPFPLPGELEEARIVDLEWDGARSMLWAVDRAMHRVLGLGIDLRTSVVTVEKVVGGIGRSGLHFNVPLDLDLDGSGALWVLDSLNRRAVRIDAERGQVLSVVGGDSPDSRELLPRPRALTIADDGTIWIYDDARGGLLSFDVDEDGSPLPPRGDLEGIIPLPEAVGALAASPEGIWVGQPMRSRVLRVVPSP
jgi:hypothetical protein